MALLSRMRLLSRLPGFYSRTGLRLPSRRVFFGVISGRTCFYTSPKSTAFYPAFTAGWAFRFLRGRFFSRTHFWSKFFKLRQSTAFYSALTTIFRAQAVLSGTYFFFASKSRKKSAGIGDEKKYFKNKIFKNKVAENFLLD